MTRRKKTYRRRSEKQNKQEPEFNQTNIYPTCENGEILDCQENTSNEVLDESCKGILMFTSETTSCFCRGSNDLKRKSENILRQGWSKYTR